MTVRYYMLNTVAKVQAAAAAAAAAKSLQSCLTLCDPIDSSPPDSPVLGILQARTLEWVAISFSNARKWKMKVKSLSRVQLFTTPWTAAYQGPPSMGFSRQEYSRPNFILLWKASRLLVYSVNHGFWILLGFVFFLLLLSHISHVQLCATP